MMRSGLILALGVCALGQDTPQQRKDAMVKAMNDCWAAPVVLKDVADGWNDDCLGLGAADLVDGKPYTIESCKAACYADSACAVWQFHENKCYYGVPTGGCRTRGGDFKADGGQRIQHGTIRKVDDAVGRKVLGLKSFKMSSGDQTVDQERCKNQCYSDVSCGVWQFSEQTNSKGCWVENLPNFERKGENKDTPFAKDVEFGEFIQHVCPPKPEEPADNRWLYALIAALVALFGLCLICYMMQKKPKTKKTRAVKIEPKPEPVVTYFVQQPTVLVQQPVYQPVPQTTYVQEVVPQTTFVQPQTSMVATQQLVSQTQPLVSQPLLGGSVVLR